MNDSVTCIKTYFVLFVPSLQSLVATYWHDDVIDAIFIWSIKSLSKAELYSTLIAKHQWLNFYPSTSLTVWFVKQFHRSVHDSCSRWASGRELDHYHAGVRSFINESCSCSPVVEAHWPANEATDRSASLDPVWAKLSQNHPAADELKQVF